MRTTIDIDPDLISEALRLSGARSKREIVAVSLLEYIRRRRILDLKSAAGTMYLDLDPEMLDRLRSDE